MRPAGDIRLALLEAVQERPGSTMRELAARAQVGLDSARWAINNMRRSGCVRRGGERAVPHHNRPVATWYPVAANDEPFELRSDPCELENALRRWG